jgi:long-chain acyl-CoA synthetase
MSVSTLPDLFCSAVQRLGTRTALRQKKLGLWHDITWREYYEKSKYIAMALISLDFKKGDKVAIIGDNSPEWVMIDVGCISVGGVTVGIYATNSWQMCEYIVDHSESTFLFVENEEQLDKWIHFRDNIKRLNKIVFWQPKGLQHFEDSMVLRLDEFVKIGKEYDSENPHLFRDLNSAIKPADPAMIIYTSGTTGQPKGAVLTHTNITWMAEAIAKINPLFETDEVLSFLPLCHIFERLFSVITHLKCGYIVNFIENLDTVTANMKEISPTVGYGVPRVWEKYHSSILIKMYDATWFKKLAFKTALRIGKNFVKYKEAQRRISFFHSLGYRLAHFIVFRKLKKRLGFDRMRIAYSGAAPISPDILVFFRSIGVNLQEGYGQTEGTGVTSVCKSDNYKVGTVGMPLPGSEVKLLHDGEILVKSPAVFLGYYKDAESTKATVKEGWLHSGDTGELDGDGSLRISGRKKDIIITTGGKNIAPQFLENQLKFSPYINDAVVMGDKRKFVTAMIMIDEDNVVKYAQDNKIQFSTYRGLTGDPHIFKLIQKEVDRVNEQLAHVEQIKKFAILPKKLYEEDGEVTPTLKIKRNNIENIYSDLIEKMYE